MRSLLALLLVLFMVSVASAGPPRATAGRRYDSPRYGYRNDYRPYSGPRRYDYPPRYGYYPYAYPARPYQPAPVQGFWYSNPYGYGFYFGR